MGSQRAILLLLIAIQVYYESVLAKSVHHPDDAYSDNEKAHLTRSQSSVPSENLKARQTLSDHSVGHVGTNAITKKSAARRAFNLPPISPFPEEPYRRSFINRSPDYINKRDKRIQLEEDHEADPVLTELIRQVYNSLVHSSLKNPSGQSFHHHEDDHAAKDDGEEGFIIRVPKRPPSDHFEEDARPAKDEEETYTGMETQKQKAKCASSDDFEDDVQVAKDDGEEGFIIRVPKRPPRDHFEEDARPAKDEEETYTGMEAQKQKAKCA